jgi:hypothetical protein
MSPGNSAPPPTPNAARAPLPVKYGLSVPAPAAPAVAPAVPDEAAQRANVLRLLRRLAGKAAADRLANAPLADLRAALRRAAG